MKQVLSESLSKAGLNTEQGIAWSRGDRWLGSQTEATGTFPRGCCSTDVPEGQPTRQGSLTLREEGGDNTVRDVSLQG